MIISFDKQFLFLHIPKTAGISISTALRPYRNPLERSLKARIIRRLPLLNPTYYYVNFDAHPHWSILKAKTILPDNVFEHLHKFTFVRHPVNWQISMFKHIMRHEGLKGFQEKFAPVYKYRRFEDYIRWRIDLGPIPQMTQMLDMDGKLLVDFVGRFENLASDFRDICQKINITTNLERLNQSPSGQSVTITRSLRMLIMEAYQIDVEAFGYDEEVALETWQLDKSRTYPSVAQLLRKVGQENFNPWQVYKL